MIGLDPWDDATSRRDSHDDGAPARRSDDSMAPGSDESWDDDEYEDWLFL